MLKNHLIFTLILSFFCFNQSCVTPASANKPVFKSFPESFYAEQKIKIKAKNEEHYFLAQVAYSPNETTVVYLEPFMQRPILTMSRKKGEALKVRWGHNMPDEFKSKVEYIFDSMMFLFEQKSFYGTPQKVEDSLEGLYLLKNVRFFDKCLFPELVEISYQDKVNISIHSYKVLCEALH